ncbi:MAG: hypothetical protein A3K77_00790 [Euryarchaeota archaeon RBG_13_31_8]|nr:MAG: hypothetical protein A3K77_00790 [Euryarchaeota archaeon RBG_13_31_8]
MTLGYLLKSLRLKENLSQKEMARKLDITPGYLCDIEHGRERVSERISTALTKKINDVFKIAKEDVIMMITLPPASMDAGQKKKFVKLQDEVFNKIILKQEG